MNDKLCLIDTDILSYILKRKDNAYKMQANIPKRRFQEAIYHADFKIRNNTISDS